MDSPGYEPASPGPESKLWWETEKARREAERIINKETQLSPGSPGTVEEEASTRYVPILEALDLPGKFNINLYLLSYQIQHS